MLIEKNLNHAGERLRRARILAGISTRREFEKKYQVSANTLQGWEQGKNPLSKKGAKRILEALKNEGLICSLEWLIHGNGVPPRAFEMTHGDAPSKNDLDAFLGSMHLQEEQAIYQELQAFKINNANSIIITISDDAMEPQFRAGDYVGGVRLTRAEDIQLYSGQPCIVELADHTILPRYMHADIESGTYTLSCTNFQSKAAPLNVFNAKIISAAPILWHRKKLLKTT
ncbi:MAG: helix-turn-helix transcriptional regulator [Gammaproteobacteria bacterium]|nr:helix-turn-helix transcriptional regulator [Gammaproteobacteria bacterium]